MSTSGLPEDLNQWPADPYRLLGVSPGVSLQQLRRAYTALIRVYKPEQYPEQFRRIREAYDHLCLLARFLPPPAENLRPEESPPPPAPGSELPASASASPTPEEWWERACEGAEADAYRRLVVLDSRQPGHPDLCVRLYWLLALCPELDAGRHRRDWLVCGLVRNGLTYPLLELYLRELEEDAEEACSERCGRLLQSRVPPARLASLARGRWQALRSLGRCEEVAADLEELRRWVPGADPESWVELLLTAIDALAWHGDYHFEVGSLTERLCEEMDNFEALQLRLGQLWDRRDYLLALTMDWRRCFRQTPKPGHLLELVERSWFRPAETMRLLWWSWLAEPVRNPSELLRVFQAVVDSGPVLLGYIRDQLHQLPLQPLAPAPWLKDDEWARLRGLTADWPWRSYDWIRLAVLGLYLREGWMPETVAAAIHDLPCSKRDSQLPLAVQLLQDWPLRLTCLAHRVFWA